jgi:hypothetical protein
MVHFQTENASFGTFWVGLGMENFHGHLVFVLLRWYSTYMAIWYVCGHIGTFSQFFAPRKIWQP